MSAIPVGAYTPQNSHPFLASAVEQTDRAILTNDQAYALKGGDQVFLAKVAAGLASAGLYVTLFERSCEVRKFNVRGSTFFWSNVIGIGTMLLVQRLYLNYTGNYDRYRLHQLALFTRYIDNMGFIQSNKKKPKVH